MKKIIKLLNTDKETKLFLFEDRLSATPSYHDSIVFFRLNRKPKNLYIISNDNIKLGDWCLDMEEYSETRNNLEDIFVYRSVGQDHWDNRKIIATTDLSLDLPLISDEFIKLYKRSYNNGDIIKYVDVKYNSDIRLVPDSKFYYDNESYKSAIDRYEKGETVKMSENVLYFPNIIDNYVIINLYKSIFSREEVEVLLDKLKDELSNCIDGVLISENVYKKLKTNLLNDNIQ